jgi:hypothetical protein
MEILSSKPKEEKSLEDHWKEANIAVLRQMDQEPKVPSLYRQKALPNMPIEEENQGRTLSPQTSPQVCDRTRRSGSTDLNLRTFAERLHQ